MAKRMWRSNAKEYTSYYNLWRGNTAHLFAVCAGTILGGNATIYGMLIGLVVGMLIEKK